VEYKMTMSTYDPETLDYDEDLRQRLSPLDKDVLLRFYNHYCGEIDQRPFEERAHTEDELTKIIAARLDEQVGDFWKNMNF
jgi:hypothetical protein